MKAMKMCLENSVSTMIEDITCEVLEMVECNTLRWLGYLKRMVGDE